MKENEKMRENEGGRKKHTLLFADAQLGRQRERARATETHTKKTPRRRQGLSVLASQSQSGRHSIPSGHTIALVLSITAFGFAFAFDLADFLMTGKWPRCSKRHVLSSVRKRSTLLFALVKMSDVARSLSKILL